MQSFKWIVLALGSFLILSPAANAQQSQGGQGGGALDTLNRAINPDRGRDDRGTSGSSARDDRSGSNYSRYSDQDLRAEQDRLANQSRQIQRDQRDLQDELDRRRGRR
jgi:hypothetical protein